MTTDFRSRDSRGHYNLSRHHEPLERGLGSEINECTRSFHTQLNKLIIERLALALPPATDSPRFYAAGLEAFANVYFAFELEWLHLTANFRSELNNCQNRSPHDRKLQLREKLLHLRPHGLERHISLKNDLDYLYNVLSSSNDICEAGSDLTAQQWQRQRLHTIGPREKQYTARVHEAVSKKPHLLFAYAWIMYLAIFSGGRWIRAQLKAAGGDFWKRRVQIQQPPAVRPLGEEANASTGLRQCSGFEFLCFSDDTDGEDIRREFKSRFDAACEDLNPIERRDVIDEAQIIFKNMIALVEELDKIITAKEYPFMSNKDSNHILSNSLRIHVEAQQYAQPTVLQIVALKWRNISSCYSAGLFGPLLLICLISGVFIPQILFNYGFAFKRNGDRV